MRMTEGARIIEGRAEQAQAMDQVEMLKALRVIVALAKQIVDVGERYR